MKENISFYPILARIAQKYFASSMPSEQNESINICLSDRTFLVQNNFKMLIFSKSFSKTVSTLHTSSFILKS